MRRSDLENSLKVYLNELYKCYPCYEKYLELNNDIALYLLDIYDQETIPKSTEYKQELDVYTAIDLAHEIISSISEALGITFIELIKQRSIYFISPEEQDFSCTYSLDGVSYSSVNNHDNICTVMCLVHEFFHNIHLDKYHGDMKDEEWFFYTEIFGLMGDFYSAFYLLRGKKQLRSDVKNYLCNFFESMVACSDRCLITGMIIDIYTKKKSLSTKAIKDYVKERGLSKEAENILNLLSEEDDDYEYYKEVPYIFAFPVAFQLAANVLTNQEYKQRFVDMFDKVADIKAKEWFQVMGVFEHTKDSHTLNEVMNAYYTNMIDVYTLDNPKIKKIGDL